MQVITTSICTCCTSLVVRVISDGGPNRVTSRALNRSTWPNRVARRSRPNDIAARAPKNTAATEADDLDDADREHPAADVHDVAGVAAGHALVDDVGVQAGQVERGEGADQLQPDHRGQPAAVGPQVTDEQADEHGVKHAPGRPTVPAQSVDDGQHVGQAVGDGVRVAHGVPDLVDGDVLCGTRIVRMPTAAAP